MSFEPENATIEMHAVREVAMLVLRGPPTADATSPTAWCTRAGVDPETFGAWEREHGEAFRRWFFAEVDPLAPMARRARNVRFWASMDRSLDTSSPNASILKLYAEIAGLVGRNAAPITDRDDNDDDTEAWALIEGLPLAMLQDLATRAGERERSRVTATAPDVALPDAGDATEGDDTDEDT